MAQDTLGRRIKDGAKRVRIFGEEYDVRAQVESIDAYSAHADQGELLRWAAEFDEPRVQQLFLVHGEPTPSATLSAKLRDASFKQVQLPTLGQSFEF
jgi:metallo-beta-lactamase family protein